MMPRTDTVFYGTSNPGKDFDVPGQGGHGLPLYRIPVVALDPKSGKLKWYRQEIVNDVWDYDAPYEVMLFQEGRQEFDRPPEQERLCLRVGQEYQQHREHPEADQRPEELRQGHRAEKTGKLVERVELTMNKEALICPSTFGAAQLEIRGAYNPKTGLWYNDVLGFCRLLKPVEQKVDPKDYGTGHTGSNDFGRLVMAPDGRKPGKLSAQQSTPAGERIVWSVDMDVPGFSCVLTTGVEADRASTAIRWANCRHTTPTLAVALGLRAGSGMPWRHRQLRGRYSENLQPLVAKRSGWGSYAAILMPALLPQLEKVTGGFDADRLQVSEVSYQLGRLGNGPPRFPKAKDVEYLGDDSVRNDLFPWLDGRTTSRR